eukprot:CAMPEP_0117026458 /NCGR_PEP_ID=MMETSP0472-20121206/19451_1 /TAXON_ID=693140 ORGANISM="Tiarina fusus, Strain LIS" /NCGR_SAMPLE_ID=MMETSP0472 /ASSEMBLY_ACC=CAM_ASM_000603 /LENGTH=244 /DNA_ID=CAMNT_0004733473 /DNA_START=49 /DNA_END=783 /DNA_ORIENTATION=-
MNKLLKGLRGIMRNEEEITLSPHLREKTILVVGAQTSAGTQICKRLAEEHHKLALACETKMDSLNALSKDLIEKGATVNLFQFSLGDEENIKDVVEGTIGQFDSLDALVLALEEPFIGDIDNVDPTSLIQSSLDANYFTHIYFTYFALPYLRKCRGKVILLSSFNEEVQSNENAIFYATRGATLAFFETLQEEESGISVIIVHGANTHPRELADDGSHIAASNSNANNDADIRNSANLVITASR